SRGPQHRLVQTRSHRAPPPESSRSRPNRHDRVVPTVDPRHATSPPGVLASMAEVPSPGAGVATEFGTEPAGYPAASDGGEVHASATVERQARTAVRAHQVRAQR